MQAGWPGPLPRAVARRAISPWLWCSALALACASPAPPGTPVDDESTAGAGGATGSPRPGVASRNEPRPPDAASPDTTGPASKEAAAETSSPDGRPPGDGPPPDAAPDVGPARPAHPSDHVFDEGRLLTYSLTISAEDWRRLQETILQEQYVPATLKVDDEVVGRIGVRYKGAWGTLQSCLSGGRVTCKKLSFKLKFDEYQPALRFRSLKRLNLHSQKNDPTHLHERLGYQLFREMGIPAPRSVHGRLVINGRYEGLFGVTEAIDGRFTDYWFRGDGDGNLYKEAWPTSSDAAYYQRAQKTNEGERPPTRILAASRALGAASTTDLPRALDSWFGTDHVMRLLAVDRAITHWDGPLTFYCHPGGCGNHNFYVYESGRQDRLWLIPWDLDYTFSVWWPWEVVGPWNEPPADCGRRWPVWNNVFMHPGCDRILRGFGSAGRQRWVAALDQLLAGPFRVEKMRADIDRWASQLGEAVRADGNGPGPDRWQQAVRDLKRDLQVLRDKATAMRDGRSTAPLGLKPGGVTTFEGGAPLAFALGTRASSNPASAAEVRLNDVGPIAGTLDAHLAFELRNQTDGPAGAFSQQASVRFAFNYAQVDLRALSQLRLRLRADAPRAVRVDVTAHTPRGWATASWDSRATPTGDVATLALRDLRVQQGFTAAEILQRATWSTIAVQPNGRDSAGLLPAGTADRGWLRIDDIALTTN